MKPIIFVVLAIAVLGVDLLPQDQIARTGQFDFIGELCKKNGVEDKVEYMKNVTNEYTECLNKYIDMDTAMLVLREAMENNVFLAGNFTEYCTKIPQLKACRSKFVESVLPCADEATGNYLTVTANSEAQILEYICHESGDRISKFVTEGGLQCVKNSTTMICVERYRTAMTNSIQTLSLSVPEFCPVLNNFQDCMSPQIAACGTTTASNLFDALLKILRDNYSCKVTNKS